MFNDSKRNVILMAASILFFSNAMFVHADQSEVRDQQTRFHNCMLQHMDKAHTEGALVLLSDICQIRSKSGQTESSSATSGNSDQGKIDYCAYLGFEYNPENGRCIEK